MTFLSPLTTDDERRQRGGVMQDGERIGFDLAVYDRAPAAGRMYLSDHADPHLWARQVRDHVRDNSAFAPDRACISGEVPQRTAAVDRTADTNRLLRDLARAAQYA